MAWESPRVQKALEESAARQRVRQAAAEAGPRLRDDKDKTSIIVPSADYHSDLIRTLRSAGFHFSDLGGSPYWWRSTAQPLNRKRYTPAAWLAWARRHYAAAWEWERPNDDSEIT